MDRARFLQIVREGLDSIHEGRLFDTERGYQGALVAQLETRLAQSSIWPGNPLVEQEYQKTIERHGLTLRPDIIVHLPFDRGGIPNRQEGNYAVIQLKLRGRLKKALNDYCKLALMCSVLHYSVGVFINIDSDATFFSDYEGEARVKLYAFAVRLRNGSVAIEESGIV